MWLERICAFTRSGTFAPGADPRQLTAVEQALNVGLPAELRALLLESNGVRGEYAIELVWSVERIEADNRLFRTNPEFRQLYMPFDHLLFFADAGNGDQFAFAVLDGEVRRPDVYAWDHENDSRKWVAPSLGKYLEWWTSGDIKL